MLQEAQHDPPESGNLTTPTEEQGNHGQDRDEDRRPAEPSTQQQQPPPPQHHLHQPPNHRQPDQEHRPITLHNRRNDETFDTYLMLATMLKHLNNGHAFAENHLED